MRSRNISVLFSCVCTLLIGVHAFYDYYTRLQTTLSLFIEVQQQQQRLCARPVEI